jgi:hypothetical protein
MAIHTGENEQGLRGIIDLTRAFSFLVLFLHFYYFCGKAFASWGLTATLSDRIMIFLARTGMFNRFETSKWITLGFLLISLLAVKGKKEENLRARSALAMMGIGLVIYFGGYFCIFLDLGICALALLYMFLTLTGYILVLAGGTLLSRVVRTRITSSEYFNRANETFPQEERLLVNDFSVNLPATYRLRGKTRKSWVNIINPRRGLLVMGSPGSGKSWFIVENIIRQQIEKGFAMFIYDFKYPDLSRIAYNHFLTHRAGYPRESGFYCVNFSDPNRAHRCNPLLPEMMSDILDAMEASKTMLLSINKTWAGRQGEFFVESPINFLAAVIWFLRNYEKGKFCTLPHVIELLQLDYDKLFTVLNIEPEVQALVSPFLSAYLSDVMETVESQIASARIPMGRLSSPQLYYILSGNDFTLDINNPEIPKIVCLGNDPIKSEALAPVISLICDRMNKIINQKGKCKSSTIYDEFGTIRVASVNTVLMTGRSNDIVVVMALQDFSMLKKTYSREEAETILNATGNVIFGQVSGETARVASERFPKILQDRQSLSISSSDVSVNKSKHLDLSIPPATISGLSSGEFVGLIADNPACPVELKSFHCKILRDEKKAAYEKMNFQDLPCIRTVEPADILRNYARIKQDVQDIFISVLDKISRDPALTGLIVRKQ